MAFKIALLIIILLLLVLDYAFMVVAHRSDERSERCIRNGERNTMIRIEDGFGYSKISDTCVDCEFSYVDDLFHEWQCKRKKCKYTKAEQIAIAKKEQKEWNKLL